MENDKLIATLQEIRSLVDRALSNSKGRKPSPRPRNDERGTGPSAKNKLPSHILELRDKGFLKQPKTAKEVQIKLEPTYSCHINRVAMALLRLHSKKQLRKTSKIVDEKKQIAYVW